MKNITQVKTLHQITKLKPTFKFGGITMVEWFNVTNGDIFVCIHSGLNHADGKTKSPFHYEKTFVGKNCKKDALNDFNEFLKKCKTLQK